MLQTANGEVAAIDRLSFSLARGKTLGIVGESGSGKSLTALTLLRLLPRLARYRSGEMLLQGLPLQRCSEREMRAIRGGRIGMIFQDPMSSLNPTMRIGEQIAEVLREHRRLTHREAWERARELCELVHIPSAARRLDEYPHQLSGGMRQRVMIAIALACEPELVIADEPTTALDVTIQAQIIALMCEMQERLGMAILLITHDFGVVAEMCDDVLVMYAGRAVEKGTAEQIFVTPQMPYTRALLASLPRIDDDLQRPLRPINGQPPRIAALPTTCVFAPRCPDVYARCIEPPPLFTSADGHGVRCWHVEEGAS